MCVVYTSIPVSCMYARVVVVFVFPASRGDQVPLQKDVKVNWVRPGQVVHESQQVATFLDIGVAPGRSRAESERD